MRISIPGDDSWISKACIAIIAKSKTQEELDTRLAILTTDKLLSFYKKRAAPAMPLALVQYRNFNDERKAKFDKENPDWKKSDKIVEYIKESSLIESENESDIYWLKHWIKLRGLNDERREKLKIKLEEIDPTTKKDPEIEAVINVVGGKVIKQKELF